MRKVIPQHKDTRTVSGFLWFRKIAKAGFGKTPKCWAESRWLEHATWIEEYNEQVGRWFPKHWRDEE